MPPPSILRLLPSSCSLLSSPRAPTLLLFNPLRLPSLSASKPPTSHSPIHRAHPPHRRTFTTTPSPYATLNQVIRGCRVAQRARKPVSPALVNRPQMKGVCLKVGITKPKKPNSGERKTARVRLSSGRAVTCYIQGEGMRDFCLLGSVWMQMTMGASMGRGNGGGGDIGGAEDGVGRHYEETELVEEQFDVG